MKILITAIALTILSTGAFAQQKDTKTTDKKAPATTKKTSSTTTYRCPTCSYSSDKKGECPKDKIDLVKVGDYYCPDCYMSSSKPGKCEMCGVEMKKMEAVPATKK